MARIVSVASAGCDPSIMGRGPVPATKKALKRAGLTLDDIDYFELNEAFAAQSLAVVKEMKLTGAWTGSTSRVAPSPSATRWMLRHADYRGDRPRAPGAGRSVGLATMCIGLGQGVSTIIERI